MLRWWQFYQYWIDLNIKMALFFLVFSLCSQLVLARVELHSAWWLAIGGGDTQLKAPIGSLEPELLAILAVTNLISPLDCERQKVQPITSQVLHPLSNHFPWALYQMDV